MATQSSNCESCGSKDNLKTFDNNSTYCFTPSCKYNENKKDPRLNEDPNLVQGVFSAIPARRISQRTCEFFNYQSGVDNGEPVQIANFAGGLQQIRTKDKRFYFKGDRSKMGLWGKDKWNKGKTIIITEGQIDAMSIAEAQDCKWPVVSLPNGAASARKTLQAELDWLLGFESIILCFDNDEAGKLALENVTDLFPCGRLKLASLSEKDANDCLVKGKHEELTKIVFNAQEYRPDGITWGSEIDWEELRKPKPRGLSLPYPILDEMIRGLKKGRIYTIYGGTGLGKSTLMKEIGFHLLSTYPDVKFANIFLEEGLAFTATSYLAIKYNIPTWKLEEEPTLLTNKEWADGKELIKDLGFYEHFGSLDSKRLFSLFEYLAVGKGIKVILLDHISLLISGLESSKEGERKDLDFLMTNLRSFTERTGCIIVDATQLKRKSGAYSEGETITESDARGSGSIEHISDVIVSINVDTTSDNPYDAQLMVVKNRITGRKGKADLATYDFDTGRYLPKKLDNVRQHPVETGHFEEVMY